jgi:hypothetical protein
MDKAIVEAGIAVVVCVYVIQKLFELIKYLFSKKEVRATEQHCGFQKVECTAESKAVNDIRVKQTNDQHEKMIELMTTATTTLALMNETTNSTNAKSARIEKDVNFIKQQMT